ncbi:MAG: hypothetical protein Q8940_18550 [Bacteroidota bacterium]|nr:hypothetical protein [Bacteroidota bacterium]
MITELVKLNLLEAATDEQLIVKSDLLINDFMKKQEGFIDAELIKEVDKNVWTFIYHFVNIEKLKAIGEAMRKSKEFAEFITLITPGSLSVTIYHQLSKW